MLLALALLASTLPAAPALAQESPPRDGRRQERDRNDDDRNDDEDDEDERALPFDTDRLFVPRWRLTDGPHVHAAFRPVVSQVRTATVQVFCDGKRRGLGGVVGADGWILTKATPLCDEVTCELADGRRLVGRTVSTNRQYDLALVKVQASGLPALSLADEVPIEVGAWLATVGTTRDPIAVGVVSVPAREIPAQPGRLGI
ncbi:MAG TPA: trypsin-like peptidase domain-containing protein, partial [Lacipirellulaceae bacterium]|nr:trypsin-like peptidase domain-containing protein [Lacipirellulaceae bacterium]